MAQQFKIYRETALPSSLEAYAVYLVAPTDKPDYVEMYVTDSTGSKAKRHFNETDVKALISESLVSAGQLSVVDDIAARDKISSPTSGAEVFVLDATGDSTVTSGSARYIYHNSAWIKVSETESMDLKLTWDNIQDKPSSSASQIDAAVANSHTHSNKTQLDKIGEDESGNLTYGGSSVKTEWTSVAW